MAAPKSLAFAGSINEKLAGAASNGAMGGDRGLTQTRSMMEFGLGALTLPRMAAGRLT